MIDVTIFPNKYAKKARAVPLAELDQMLVTPPQRPRKEACELFSFARYGQIRTGRGSLRSDENVIEITGIAGDYDNEKMPMEQARDALGLFGVRARLKTSANHKPEAPRWHVICPCSKELPKTEHSRLMARLNGVLGGVLGVESFALSRSYYFGAVAGVEYVTLETSGRCIDELPELDDFAIGKEGKQPTPGNGTTSGRPTDGDLRALIVHGEAGRIYTAMLSLSSRLASRGKPAAEIVRDLEALLNACEWQQRDPTTWRARYSSVAGMAESAVKKYAPDGGGDNKHVIIGGALTMALAMPDLEFVSSPIFTKGQLGTITGHPGSGKTTLITGLCVAQALALPFGPITPETDGLVYIVSAEDFQGTRNRILAEAARLQLCPDDRARLDARLRWVHVETSATPTAINEAIERDAAGQPVALIFVDTGPALFAGESENDNVELRNFVEGFAKWRHLPGNPVTVLAWHPSKGATADRLEPRGASAIKGTCDFNLTIWRDDDRVTLGYTKVRAQHFDPIEGRLSAVELVAASGQRYFAPVVTLDVDDRSERSDAGAAREAILEKMQSTRANPSTVRDLAIAAGLSRAATWRHLQHLAGSKPAMVAKDPVDDRYSLTKAGEARAKTITERSRRAYERAQDPG